jgi:hypothetical protein
MSQTNSELRAQSTSTALNVAPQATSGRQDKPVEAGKVAVYLVGALVVFVLGILIGGLQWFLLSKFSTPRTSDDSSSVQTRAPAASSQSTASTDSKVSSEEVSKAINDRMNSGKPDDRQPLSEALAAAEAAYPTDYRFPFEHAKLVVTGQAHHHAFGLLFIAAERAIDAGQADALLALVKKEKDGAFYQCSRGHAEWKTLESALEKKDKTVIENSMANMKRDLIGGSDDMTMAPTATY